MTCENETIVFVDWAVQSFEVGVYAAEGEELLE